MPKRDPERDDRLWARRMGGAYIPKRQRDTRIHMVDHPLWCARQLRDADLCDAVRKAFNNKKRRMPKDKIFLLNLTKPLIDMSTSFVIMKHEDFADLCVGTPAGERDLERERSISGAPMPWALITLEDDEDCQNDT